MYKVVQKVPNGPPTIARGWSSGGLSERRFNLLRGARRGALGDWRLSLRQSRRYNRNIRRSLAPRREKNLPFRTGNDKKTSSISYFARCERRAPGSAPASNDLDRHARRSRGPAIDGSATCSDAPTWRRASRFRANCRRDSDRTKREAALPLRRTQLSGVASPTRRWSTRGRGEKSIEVGGAQTQHLADSGAGGD